MAKKSVKRTPRAPLEFTKPQVARYSTTHEISLDVQFPGLSGPIGFYRTIQEYAVNPGIMNTLLKAVKNKPDLPKQLMDIATQMVEAYNAIERARYGIPGVPMTVHPAGSRVASAAAGAKAGFDIGKMVDGALHGVKSVSNQEAAEEADAGPDPDKPPTDKSP